MCNDMNDMDKQNVLWYEYEVMMIMKMIADCIAYSTV